jgi:hypothetical protein
MKKTLAMALFCSLALVAAAQNTVINDPYVVERKVGDFSGISISGSIDLFYSPDADTKVLVSSSDRDMLDRIETYVKNGVLHIRIKDKDGWDISWKNRRLRAYVSAPPVKMIDASGSGNVRVEGKLKTEVLNFNSSGSGNVEALIEVDRLVYDHSGSGNANFSGTAGKADINTSGSGNFISPALVIDKCDVDASGSGNIEVTVNKEISADTSGSGNIRLRGEGMIRNLSTSGSGKIKRVSK